MPSASRAHARHLIGDSIKGRNDMGLKAPGILTFTLAIVLTVAVLIVKLFGAEIPLVTGNEFWALLLAHLVLILGNIMRGL